MPHLPGTAEEIRSRVPAAQEAFAYTRDNVLRGGVVDAALKELCFRYLAEDPDLPNLSRFAGRERAGRGSRPAQGQRSPGRVASGLNSDSSPSSAAFSSACVRDDTPSLR